MGFVPCGSSYYARASLKAHHGGAAIGGTQGARNREIGVEGSGCRVLELQISGVGLRVWDVKLQVEIISGSEACSLSSRTLGFSQFHTAILPRFLSLKPEL